MPDVRRLVTGVLSLLACSAATLAQETGGRQTGNVDPGADQPAARIRFTPGMARAMGNTFARDVFVRQYSMDESKADEAADRIATRLMEAARVLDSEASQQAVERIIEAMLKSELARRRGERGGALGGAVSLELAQAAGAGLLPMLPTIRTLIRDVGRDMLPMLPPKMRIKLTTDWMAVGTALNGFEKVMERWSAGEIKADDNPFEPNEKKTEETASGKAAEMIEFRAALAKRHSKLYTQADWERYVRGAKEYYRLDKAQSTTVDSILADCVARAVRITEDDAWRERMYWDQVWQYISPKLPGGWRNPLYYRVAYDREKLREPIRVLEKELKSRIDQVASEAQRKSAEARLLAVLQERGYTPPE